VTYTLSIGQSLITFADASYLPAADVQQGRLANMQDAWLLLDGVTYPLVDESRNVFQGSYKYDPQLGLPRFAIIYNQVDVTTMRVYPGASQVYELHGYVWIAHLLSALFTISISARIVFLQRTLFCMDAWSQRNVYRSTNGYGVCQQCESSDSK
jgi:hypothetical protein